MSEIDYEVDDILCIKDQISDELGLNGELPDPEENPAFVYFTPEVNKSKFPDTLRVVFGTVIGIGAIQETDEGYTKIYNGEELLYELEGKWGFHSRYIYNYDAVLELSKILAMDFEIKKVQLLQTRIGERLYCRYVVENELIEGKWLKYS